MTTQGALFDLDPPPRDEQPPEYQHDVMVGDCLHVIVSIYPEPDEATHELAQWSHRQSCERAS
jgi:hypothetical protein